MKLVQVITLVMLSCLGCSGVNVIPNAGQFTANVPALTATDAIVEDGQPDAIDYPMLYQQSPGAERMRKGSYGTN